MHAYILIFVVLFFCAVLGGIAAVRSHNEVLNSISQNIYESFRSLGMDIDRLDVFRDSILRSLRFIVLAWVLGYLHAGRFFQAAIIGLRGFFMGYGVSVFIMQFGAGGLFLAIPSIFLQNIFLIFALFFITTHSLEHEKTLSEQLLVLLAALVGAVFIGLYEAYISPALGLWIFTRISG